MPEYRRVVTAPIPYLYVERSCSMDPDDISAAMAGAFDTVKRFMQQHGITATGAAMSVYDSYDPDRMTFRAGFPVSKADAARAAAPVRSAETPATKALNFRHIGPYASLRVSYADMMRYMQDNGIEMTVPAWEIYLDDADEVPEDALRTEVFVALK